MNKEEILKFCSLKFFREIEKNNNFIEHIHNSFLTLFPNLDINNLLSVLFCFNFEGIEISDKVFYPVIVPIKYLPFFNIIQNEKKGKEIRELINFLKKEKYSTVFCILEEIYNFFNLKLLLLKNDKTIGDKIEKLSISNLCDFKFEEKNIILLF